MTHVHEWVETEVHCEDCGSHPAVSCADPDCPLDPVDLIYNDDPRAPDAEPARPGSSR